MPTEPEPISVSQVVHRAVEVCDPAGHEEGVSRFLAQFEDRDDPVTSVADVETEVLEAKGALDPQDEDPALVMASAVAVYLAYRRNQLETDRRELLRLAARAEFDGEPPPAVAAWLSAQGVDI